MDAVSALPYRCDVQRFLTWGSIDITPTETDGSQPRRPSRLSPHPVSIRVVRFALACVLSVGATDALWQLVPGTLKASTDVVGFPIFADFDFTRYFDAYYLIALVLPAFVLFWYHVLAWRGPLRKPRETRAIRPVLVAASDGQASRPFAQVRAPKSDFYAYLAQAVRLVLPATTVALEISSLRPPGEALPTTAGWVAGIAYVVVVTTASALASRVFASRGLHDDRPGPHVRGPRAAAIVRSGAAICVVPLLFVVSHSTTVAVLSDHRIVHYPWLPLWAVVVASVGVAIWFAARMLRGESGQVRHYGECRLDLRGRSDPRVPLRRIATGSPWEIRRL